MVLLQHPLQSLNYGTGEYTRMKIYGVENPFNPKKLFIYLF